MALINRDKIIIDLLSDLANSGFSLNKLEQAMLEITGIFTLKYNLLFSTKIVQLIESKQMVSYLNSRVIGLRKCIN